MFRITKHILSVLAQACLSVVLLLYIFIKIDINQTADVILTSNGWFIGAGTIVLLAQPLLVALRWKIVIHFIDGSIPWYQAVRLAWIGAFFNIAVPGSIGGDAIRIWLYVKLGAQPKHALASVVIERLLMLLSLMVIVLALQPLLSALGTSQQIVSLTAVSLIFALSTIFLLIFFSPIMEKRVHWPIISGLLHFATGLRKILQNPKQVIIIFLVSVFAYLNMSITFWLISIGLYVNISLTDCMVLFPVIVLVTTLPISIGGWGVREGITIVLFSLIGVTSYNSLAISVLFGLVSIIITLPGAVLWIHGKFRKADIATNMAVRHVTDEIS